MKKNYWIILLIPFLLTSCTPKNDVTILLSKDSSIIYNEEKKEFHDYTISLTTNELKTYIDNKESFVLIFYGINCEACNRIKPLLINYICETQYVIHSLNANDEGLTNKDLENTLNRLDDLGPMAFPRVYFVNEGKSIFTKNGFSNQDSTKRSVKKLFDFYIDEK